MPPDPRLVLVCNSHIDPVWLWPWEEGLAQTLATFRAAAGFCETVDGFVFCHNEALLYRWVEEYEPALFERIRTLVARGRWHVMGGWHLQPDCNLPSGESFVRQVLSGKRYFLDRFGVEPRVAVNLDPFGHTRGLVQVLAKAGYTGYLFCRPDSRSLPLPGDDFVWVGYDGSRVLAHRAPDHYNSWGGRAREKVEAWLAANPDRQVGLLLWGVGNHGGGPSRADLDALAALVQERPERAIVHGRPEDYFAALAAREPALPRVARDLNPWAVGCYASMATVKQRHRRLEQALYSTEKILAAAVLNALLAWPASELADALDALLFCQFHDILPGSSVREVEEQALDRLGHGLDIVSRLRARGVFAYIQRQPPAAGGDYPIFVYNHHPFPVDEIVTCELQPPEPNADPAVLYEPDVRDASGAPVPAQTEKESCNIQVDQRKRIVFRARLQPFSLARFECVLRPRPRAPALDATGLAGRFRHDNGRLDAVIDADTGLLARYAVHGVPLLDARACRPLVMRDSPDPWGMKVTAFRETAGEFRLMSPATAARFAGVAAAELPPVRLIEQGPVRRVVEALFEYGHSALVLRYGLPVHGTEVQVDLLVAWNEKDRMLKLSLPTACPSSTVLGQVAYGAEQFDREAEELLAQKWILVPADDRGTAGLPAGAAAREPFALTVINDGTYGFDFTRGELRLSLLRAPAYAGHPVDDVTPIVRQDRFEPRVDQGTHRFRFWINGGPASERREAVDREAAVRNDGLPALNAFPAGGEPPIAPALVLEDAVVQLAAMKIAEDGGRLIVRLFEPTGQPRRTTVAIPPLGLRFDVPLGPYEIKTLAIDRHTRDVVDTDLLERPWPPCGLATSPVTRHDE